LPDFPRFFAACLSVNDPVQEGLFRLMLFGWVVINEINRIPSAAAASFSGPHLWGTATIHPKILVGSWADFSI